MIHYSNFDIIARDLPDAWFQAVYNVLDKGREFVIDRGSFESKKRLEYDYITLQIKYPGIKPLLPDIPSHYGIPNPVAPDYLEKYLPYLMTGKLEEGESYTYGQRLTRYVLDIPVYSDSYTPTFKNIIIPEVDELRELGIIYFDEEFKKFCLNQIEQVIWTYKNKGARNNQMTMQIAQPSDLLLRDPPCLRSIDTRLQDGQLNFIVYFRSWDLWNGFPANLAAIQMLKEYMANSIGVEDGQIIASSKGLHIYDHCWELARIIRGWKKPT